MGDVFDAMNRAKRDRAAQPPKPADPSGYEPDGDDGLPLDDFQPEPVQESPGLPLSSFPSRPSGEESASLPLDQFNSPLANEMPTTLSASPFPPEPSDDTRPALPLDQVSTRSIMDEPVPPSRLSAPPVTRRDGADRVVREPVDQAVTEAMAKSSQADRETDSTVSDAMAKSSATPTLFEEHTAAPVAAAAAKAQAEYDTARASDAAARTDSAAPTFKIDGYAPDVIVHHDRGALVTEQYRAIRTQLLARSRTRRVQTYVVTSSAPEEGKTVSVINLGLAFSELRNQRTLLIEADLRRPMFDKILDRDCPTGLLQLLRGEASEVDRAIYSTIYDNLHFMPAGGREPTHSTELLSSPRMAQLLDRLKDRYDHIFIDSPPVVSVTDAAIMGSVCDGTIMVVRLHKTPTDVIDRAKRLLRAANCDIAGVILTHLQPDRLRKLYRYAYYDDKNPAPVGAKA